MRARVRRRPWRRKDQKLSTDPAVVFHELNRRRLSDIGDCRVAWEHGRDPVAVCVALTKCALPEWLEDAVLVLLADGTSGPPLRPRLWARRTRDALDAERSAMFTGFRLLPDAPQTRESALELAEAANSMDYGVARVSTSAMKRSYYRVCRGLADDGRYFAAPSGFAERLRLARVRTLAMMESERARARDAARK